MIKKKTKKERIVIANLIDWSESFVDENGSFYCGTTEEQKRNAAGIIHKADLVVNTIDLHPITAPEHNINGGLYPVHNAVKPEQHGPDFIYSIDENGDEMLLEDKTLSPRLTAILSDEVSERRSGIIVPRGVYFQGGIGKKTAEPFCKPEDIEETYEQSIVSADAFLSGNLEYIIAPKQYFDATRIDSDLLLPQNNVQGIPTNNFNVYSLIKLKYPEDRYELVLVNTGVVEGICRLHTSIGMKQMFPAARIINISDATTPLYGVGLGYKTADESRQASTRVCKDIGIEYMTAREYLEEFG